MELVSEIGKIVEKSFDDPSVFLVDISIAKSKGPNKVKILIDSDKGLDIDQCALLSRKVGEEIEARDLISSAYTLEVSSPGIDQPLQLQRQYVKNVGRRVKILLENGKELKGELLAVSDDDISVNVEAKGKKKKIEVQETKIGFSEIQKTNVIVSFK